MIGADITSVYIACYISYVTYDDVFLMKSSSFTGGVYEVWIILERQATKLNSLQDTQNDYLY